MSEFSIQQTSPTAVVVDSDRNRRRQLAEALGRRGYLVSSCDADIASLIGGVASLDSRPDLVLIGSRVSGANSSRIAATLRRIWPKVEILLENAEAPISAGTPHRPAVSL